MLNIFNPTDNAPTTKSIETPNSGEEASVEGNRLAWYESPLMFIGVIVSLLVVVNIVERKVL